MKKKIDNKATVAKICNAIKMGKAVSIDYVKALFVDIVSRTNYGTVKVKGSSVKLCYPNSMVSVSMAMYEEGCPAVHEVKWKKADGKIIKKEFWFNQLAQ